MNAGHPQWSKLTPEQIAKKPAHVQAQIASYLGRTPWTPACQENKGYRTYGRGRATSRRIPTLTKRGEDGLCMKLLRLD